MRDLITATRALFGLVNYLGPAGLNLATAWACMLAAAAIGEDPWRALLLSGLAALNYWLYRQGVVRGWGTRGETA